MGKVQIEDDDQLINHIQDELGFLNGIKVKAGIFGEDDSFQVMKASVHEFGVTIDVTPKMRAWFAYQGYPLSPDTTEIKIPERSFIRRTFDQKMNKIDDLLDEQIIGIIEGKNSGKQTVLNLKIDLRGLIRETMHEVDKPSLGNMTQERRKGSSGGNPLIDTGTMWRAVNTKVEK